MPSHLTKVQVILPDFFLWQKSTKLVCHLGKGLPLKNQEAVRKIIGFFTKIISFKARELKECGATGVLKIGAAGNLFSFSFESRKFRE